MSKQEYLEALGAALSTLVPAKERADILRYYEEYFEEAGAENEASVIEELGDPAELAKKIAREGGFSGGEPDADEARHKIFQGRGLAVLVAVLAVVLVIVVVLLVMNSAVVRDPGNPDDVAESNEIVTGPELNGGVTETETGTPGTPSGSLQPSSEPSPVTTESQVQFTSVNVEIGIGDIALQTGDSFSVEVASTGQDRSGTAYEIQYQIQSGRLRIWSSPKNVQTENENSVTGSVVITVPADVALGEVDLKTGLGSINVEGFTASELDVETGLGDVTAENVSVGELSMESGLGDLALEGTLARSTDLETGMGDITVDTDSAVGDCAYDLESSMGSIEVDGQQFNLKAEKKTGSLYELDAETHMGNISVRFAG